MKYEYQICANDIVLTDEDEGGSATKHPPLTGTEATAISTAKTTTTEAPATTNGMNK